MDNFNYNYDYFLFNNYFTFLNRSNEIINQMHANYIIVENNRRRRINRDISTNYQDISIQTDLYNYSPNQENQENLENLENQENISCFHYLK